MWISTQKHNSSHLEHVYYRSMEHVYYHRVENNDDIHKVHKRLAKGILDKGKLVIFILQPGPYLHPGLHCLKDSLTPDCFSRQALIDGKALFQGNTVLK